MAVLQDIVSKISGFPFWWVLILLIFLVYAINVFIICYHLIRFGIGTKPKLFALIYFLGAIILFAITFYFYNRMDIQGLFSNFNFNLI